MSDENKEVREARLIEHEGGRMPASDGWYVLNVADARWRRSEAFGSFCQFEGTEVRFGEVGMHLHVVQPGQPSCLYHAETAQENFLVLSGECTLVVEDEERPLVAWDFVHCPPGTHHVFVGAGDGPCAILMVGARTPERGLSYPPSEVAARHGASAERATSDPREAYARFDFGTPVPGEWPLG